MSGTYGQADGTGRLLAGRYRVVARLGRGGMGVVWRALDEVLGREVAVKELRAYTDSAGPELADLRLRMQREARAAARVRHPAVIVVHDITQVEGRPLIVMELVDGPSLDDVLRERGTVGPREAARIGAEVLDALAAAHRVGVLHRDVKPGNILLDRSGRVVLTDFGIATMADPDDGSATHLTRGGELVGSLDYMAPERARGADPGPAADVWALGAALYAAVEGASPFSRTSTFSTLTAIVDEPLPEPHRAGPLAPVLRRLMAKRPEARPGAEEACELLREVAREPGPDTPTTALRGRPGSLGTPVGAAARQPGAGVPAGPGVGEVEVVGAGAAEGRSGGGGATEGRSGGGGATEGRSGGGGATEGRSGEVRVGEGRSGEVGVGEMAEAGVLAGSAAAETGVVEGRSVGGGVAEGRSGEGEGDDAGVAQGRSGEVEGADVGAAEGPSGGVAAAGVPVGDAGTGGDPAAETWPGDAPAVDGQAAGQGAARGLGRAPRRPGPDGRSRPAPPPPGRRGDRRTGRRAGRLATIAVAVVLVTLGLTIALLNDKGHPAKPDAAPPFSAPAGASASVRGAGSGHSADPDPVGQGEETTTAPTGGALHPKDGKASARPSASATSANASGPGPSASAGTAAATSTPSATVTPACQATGSGTYTCEVRSAAKSYSSSGDVVGKVHPGSHAFSCQADLGRRATHGRWTNVWWAETDDDSGNTGVYISDVYIEGGDNDEPLPGLPVC